jgi:hypothetical protein
MYTFIRIIYHINTQAVNAATLNELHESYSFDDSELAEFESHAFEMPTTGDGMPVLVHKPSVTLLRQSLTDLDSIVQQVASSSFNSSSSIHQSSTHSPARDALTESPLSPYALSPSKQLDSVFALESDLGPRNPVRPQHSAEEPTVQSPQQVQGCSCSVV